jgi:hypothetical protein
MRIQFASRTRGRLPKLVKLWLCLQVSALLFLVASPVHAQVKRKSVTDLSATELMSLRRGVANMMARNNAPRGSADYRRSWIYWANMHLHFGDDCAGPIFGSGMGGVQTFVATNADEEETWCKCEHGTNQFLTWHRMYLWYFERVLQDAAGDASLRLPYWDYEADGKLPAAYRDATYVNEQGQTVSNPLRVNARQPRLNDGTSSLSAGVTSTAGAMPATTFNDFSALLETTPHGAVHCAVVTGSCPNGLMGSVPVAALDPIFYAHHTNIDRLYECWLQVNEQGRSPNDTNQLDTVFTFVDSDGGTPSRKVRDMLTTTQLGYSYAAGGGCPTTVAQANTAAENVPMSGAAQAVASTGQTRLNQATTVVALSMPAPGRDALARSGRAYVTIEGLEYDEAPGGMYNVFLRGAGDKREQIGIINFFNIAPSRPGAQTSHAGHQRTRGTFRFDITDAVKQLNLSGDAALSLIFEPTTGLTGSSPEAAAQELNPQANVRFQSARVLVTP